MGHDSSETSVRNHRSSQRSPYRRERHSRNSSSPPREKRLKSPKRPKSPVRDNKHARSRSPSDRLPLKEPSPESRSRHRSSHKEDKSKSNENRKTRSPSPRSRRLRKAQADVDDKINDKGTRREKNLESERRDADDNLSRQVRTRHRSRSPPREEGNNSREDHRNGDEDSVARMKAAEEALETKEKQKPSFELSGKLAAETNRVKGVTLLFTEPPDARKPEIRWRLYVFKGGEVLNEPLYVHRQSCYLFGRERRVADIPTDHPSCSKQHAVLQYRQVDKEQPDGMLAKEVRPYIMDLGSTNGTFINDNRIEPERYYQLMEKDTIKFGNSSREYVLLHENSA